MRWGWVVLALLACDDGGTSDPLDVAPAPPVDAQIDAAHDDAAPDAETGDADLDRPMLPDADTPPPPPDCDPEEALQDWQIGGWTVSFDDSGLRWAVRRGDTVLLRSVGCGQPAVDRTLEVPRVNSVFGGFKIALDAVPRLAPDGPSNYLSTDAEGVVIGWGEGHTLTFRARGADLEITTGAPGPGGAGLYFACAEGEAFMGLGTQVVGLDLRGRRYPLWTQEQGIGKNEGGLGFPVSNTIEAAYAPMGVWHSTAGYTAVLNGDHYAELDLCSDGVGSLRTHGGPASFVLVAGGTPKVRQSAVSEYVGRPSSPPAWMFGPWNDAVGGPERLAHVAERLRAEGIPSSAIWSEDWIGGEQSDVGYRLSYAWAWDEDRYPTLPEDIEGLHTNGFAFLAYFNPFVPEPTRMWGEGVAGGYLIKDAAGEVVDFFDPAFRNASLVDLTHPEALAWLDGYLQTAARDVGADGWMADFAEWLPVEAVMHDGRTGWQAHNDYPRLWQAANREALSAVHGDDWLFFARSGWASTTGGTAGIAPVLWAGDQNTDWERYDGFPSVFPIGVNAGLAGVAFYGSDIAGYTSELAPNTTKELFYRWASAGALHPVMRTHHGSDECGNWSFERDPETLAHYRRWARVHTRLYPYLRLRANEAVMLGWPVVRHPHWVDPTDDWWRGQEALFHLGDDLIVAPVVEEGAVARRLVVPEGWLPLFGGDPAPADAFEAAAPATELPVFVRPGTVLPLLPRSVDSFYGAEAEGVTDLDDVEGTLLALYPDADGNLLLELGAGVVEGGLWTGPYDWANARMNDERLEACVDGPPCVDGDRAEAEGPGLLQVGTAQLTLPPGRFSVALGPDAWGALAEPTPLTDLSPDVPPPCESR